MFARRQLLLVVATLLKLAQLRAIPASLCVGRCALARYAAISAGVPPQLHLQVHLDLPPALEPVRRARPLDEKIAITQRFAHELLPGFARGVLRSVIDTRFALADAPAAHTLVESNATFGKVLLEV